MAGETRGELAEAIAKVALERALTLIGRHETVYWQESPDGSVIKPDFTIGTTVDSPDVLVLVNASESPSNSHIKYWRNVGEIFDSKTRLSNAPAVLNLVFRSEIKPELVRLTEAICDATCLIDRDKTFGLEIGSFLDLHHTNAPSKRDERVLMVRQALKKGGADFDPAFKKALDLLAKHLGTLLFRKKGNLKPLWDMCRLDYLARVGKPVRAERVTMLRRGLARWLVFDDSIRQSILIDHLGTGRIKLKNRPLYAEPLGMLKRQIGYFSIPVADADASDMTGTTSRDLRLAADFFKNAAEGDVNVAVSGLGRALMDAPEEMEKAASLLRLMPELVGGWQKFIVSEWRNLTTSDGCLRLLNECSVDPSMGGRVVTSPESRVWLWDHLLALIRASHGRNNDFGYSAMVTSFKADQSTKELVNFFELVLSSLDGKALKAGLRWISKTLPHSAEPGRRGFQDWLAGTKDVSPVIVAAFSYALAKLLRGIRSPGNVDTPKILSSHAYNLWNKLLTHQDFEPLPALIESACGGRAFRASASCIMGEIGQATVQDAGKMPVFAFNGGLIFWQSVTSAGRDHKRKELCGRARSLQFSFVDGVFDRRKEAGKLFLVLDGEWRDEDLKVLAESGWDGFYYPDEMDKLVAAIGVVREVTL